MIVQAVARDISKPLFCYFGIRLNYSAFYLHKLHPPAASGFTHVSDVYLDGSS